MVPNPIDAFWQAFKEKHRDNPLVSYEAFSAFALYDPQFGYYQRNENRIGFDPNADFYTSTTVGEPFPQLLNEALLQLFPKTESLTLVEIGPEKGRELFTHRSCRGFKDSKALFLGEALKLEYPSIVIANEWLDAYPFFRIVKENNIWKERNLNLADFTESTPKEVFKTPSLHIQEWIKKLPEDISEGYFIDYSLQAEYALLDLCSQNNCLGVVFLDYGCTWEALTRLTPQGSARAYFKHRQSPHLLENPGRQDLTTHVCWDRLEAILRARGFESIETLSQEAFFVRYGSKLLEEWMTSGALSAEARRRLMTLLHPGFLGRKFQVLSARRP